ncbi:Armadillo-like helical [Cinara cedri]|uniref:Armadillo-like helical n=1 Tax=Cinara cedri TaxID=506608 RepID=A0A5E4MY01_9HEMI|nr:Armadillo-like helical [Cinara cedri]
MIGEQLGLTHTTVHHILTNDLEMRKICAKMVPKILSQDQKDNRRDRCLDFLKQIENDPSFLERVITGDEPWIFEYDPETDETSQEWWKRKNISLQKLVTKPLQEFAKLHGRNGYLETHSKTKYHKDVALSSTDIFDYLEHNKQVINLINTNVAFRGHQEHNSLLSDISDSSCINEETTNTINISQMSLILRYIDTNNKVNEQFIRFLDCHEYVYTQSKYDEAVNSIDEEHNIELSKKLEPNGSGEILDNTVVSMLKEMSLELDYSIRIGTDGCAVMISSIRGATNSTN